MAADDPAAVAQGEADRRLDEMEEQFQMGLVTANERYQAAINIWTDTTNEIQKALRARSF